MLLIPPIKDGDWRSVRDAINKLASIKLGIDSTPTFSSITLSGLTASRLIQTDASKTFASVSDLTSWIAGTTNQITVTDDSDGTVTLSTPQDIHTGASPTFAGLTLNGNISLEFGDLVSEQNPDAVNAIRMKATSSDVDVVIGDSTGYFSVWNVADNVAVFYVNNVGDTDIAGNFTTTGTINSGAITATGNQIFGTVASASNTITLPNAGTNVVLTITTNSLAFGGANLLSIGTINSGTITISAHNDLILSGSGEITSGSGGFITSSQTITNGIITNINAGIGLALRLNNDLDNYLALSTAGNVVQIGVNDDADLLQLVANALTVNGSVRADGMFAVNTAPVSTSGYLILGDFDDTITGFNSVLVLKGASAGDFIQAAFFTTSVEGYDGGDGNGHNNYLKAVGVRSLLNFADSYDGTIDDVIGNVVDFIIAGAFGGGATITNFTGFWVTAPNVSANLLTPIGTVYGLRLGDMIDAKITTSWAIYSEGGDSYHVGDLAFRMITKVNRIGSDSDTTLDLYGDTSIDLHDDTILSGFLRLVQKAGTAVDGDLWNDSTQEALQTFVSGIEQTLVGVIFTQTADQTIADTTTETTLFGTGVGTLTLPANFWVVGKTIRIEIHGDFADTGNPTVDIHVFYGATKISDSSPITLSGLSGTEEWETTVIITCRSVGATGTVETVIDWEYETTTGSSAIERLDVSGTLTTIDTTASGVLDVTFQWGTAAAANTITSEVGYVEVLN